jgi:hypothetical protein
MIGKLIVNLQCTIDCAHLHLMHVKNGNTLTQSRGSSRNVLASSKNLGPEAEAKFVDSVFLHGRTFVYRSNHKKLFLGIL